jgi:hypothetical protein
VRVYSFFVAENIERKVHTVRPAQLELIDRVTVYLESYGEQGFDINDQCQVVGITQAEETAELTGVVAVRFPAGKDNMLEISHLRTVKEHDLLLGWTERMARMLGRHTLHIVTHPRDVALLAEQYGFVENGSSQSLIKQLDAKTIG